VELSNRLPVAAGRFYPDNPKVLREEIEKYLCAVSGTFVKKQTFGIVVPHAGYVFSGKTAGACFSRLQKEKVKRVVLIGSSHYSSFNGGSVYSMGDYETPLGTVEVDRDACLKLTETEPLISFVPDAHSEEHCLEVQLPFLQVHLGDGFKIVPLVLGRVSPENCREIAGALKLLADDETVFVVSTDLSHYPDYDNAKKVDELTINSILSGEPNTFLKIIRDNENSDIRNLRTSCCGWTSVLTFLYLMGEKGNVNLRVVDYSNSGDSAYGDHHKVVGYGGVEAVIVDDNEFISVKEQDELLNIARDAIVFYLKGERSVERESYSEGLMREMGAFVTVYVDDKLRGCLGRFVVFSPLYRTVAELAVSAISTDKRFEAVGVDELSQLRVQISLLSDLKRVDGPDDIIIGKHGVYLKTESGNGTLLPQVAVDNGWTAVEFLEFCSKHKVGIAADDWREAEIFVYETNILD
jgi:AmmeMemoRadiSam system protein B/AmmeMemoRadiSam system protein A